MKKLFVLPIIGVLVLALALPGAALAARPQQNALLTNVPVTGTVTDTAGTNVGTFLGQLTVRSVALVDGALQFTGNLTGTATQGGVTTPVNTDFTAVVGSLLPGGSPAACDILTLDLGPIHLDLLGLVVDLAPVNLDITAVPGPGNLLGNLLCAVAGLLDNNGLGNVLNQLLGLINQLLG